MTHQEVIKKVDWKDLRHLSVKEMLIENNLTIPWLLTSVTLAFSTIERISNAFAIYYPSSTVMYQLI